MSTISASTLITTALQYTADTTGALVFKTGATPTTALTLGADQSATFAGTVNFAAAGFTSLSISGNLTFTSTGNRILGDMSNSTLANRLMFKTSTANSNSILSVIPNGTATTTAFQAFNNSDPTNASQADFRVSGSTDVRVSSTSAGTGTYLPLTFYTNGSERMRIDTSGNVGIGVTTSTWYPGTAIQFGGSSSLYDFSSSGNRQTHLINNAYLSATPTWTYLNTDPASRYLQSNGNHYWYSAGSGTAGTTITFTTSAQLYLNSLAIGASLANLNTASTNANLQIGAVGGIWSRSSDQLLVLGANTFYGPGGDYYATTGPGARIYMQGGNTVFNTFVSGTVGTTPTFIETFRINTSGNVALQNGNISATGVGITFPATQSASSDANCLDDYEEGTWTPVLRFNGASTGMTYNVQTGNYVKVGRWVTITFNIDINQKGSSTGNATIQGMPFVNYIGLQLSAGCLQGERNMTSFNQTNAYMLVWNDGNLYCRYNSATSYVDFTSSNFNNGSCIYGCVTYETSN